MSNTFRFDANDDDDDVEDDDDDYNDDDEGNNIYITSHFFQDGYVLLARAAGSQHPQARDRAVRAFVGRRHLQRPSRNGLQSLQ